VTRPANRCHCRPKVIAGICVTGAALLGASFSTKPGSPRFYVVSLGAAGIWLLGGLRSGPRHLGWQHSRPDQLRRTVIAPIAAGAAAFGIFYVGAQIARRIPLLNAAITSVMRYTHEGSGPLMMATVVVNAIGEEVFFRGALFDAVDDRRRGVSTSTAVYSLVITATRNPALVLASGIMGTLLARQRRATGGIQASTLTHVTWSMLMLRFVPRLFRPVDGGAEGPLARVRQPLPVLLAAALTEPLDERRVSRLGNSVTAGP
jgi:membrane protease YdiL (CAAX protease family)